MEKVKKKKQTYFLFLSLTLDTGGDLHLFERMSVIRWENNRDCDITMPLSLKTMEVQIKRDQ